jgi:hypothetical protein
MEHLTLKSSQYYTNRRHNDPSYNEKVRLYQANYRAINREHILQHNRRKKFPDLQGNIPTGITIVKINKVIHLKI